jgi:alpha-D-ribose 1-methylphosphonate 5-triphosphate synthase subunit PhnH
MNATKMQTPEMQAPAAGFADLGRQSQQVFRALLESFSRPGRVEVLRDLPGDVAGLAPSAAAALLTLADYDSALWLGPSCDMPATRQWLRFHTGAPLVDKPQAAAFALLQAQQLPALDSFALGTDAAPEGGATLLIQVPSLEGAPAYSWRGPGIQGDIHVPDFGLPESFWAARASLSGFFPRGLDIYFLAGAALIGLPRSTMIQRIGA